MSLMLALFLNFADTFRVYEFDVSFVFNSCKRTPEMKAPSHLNLLIFMNSNSFTVCFFHDPVILQHTT